MAASGAKVLQLRSVEFARNHDVRLHVRSTFSDAEGTWIVDEEDPVLEKAIITGVAHTDCEPLYRVREIDAARAVRAARRRRTSTSTRSSRSRATRSSSALRVEDRARLRGAARRRSTSSGRCATTSARSALVGAGMKSHPGHRRARRSRRSTGSASSSKVISTSPIKIACHVRTEDVPTRGRGAARRVRARSARRARS